MDSVVKFTLAVIFLCPALIAAGLLDNAEVAMREAVAIIEDDYAASDGETEYIGCEYYDACENPPKSSYSSEQIPDWLTSGTPYHELCDDSTSAASFPESPDCDAASRSCSLDVSYDRATSYFTTDTDFESENVKQATCVLRDLDLKWRDSFSNILDVESYAEYFYSSVGRTGGLTTFPGTAWSCPSSYNALFRPWYPTAAIGPKNIILIIDVSGSMSGNRLTLAKAAAIRVLDTLSEYDYVGLVSFSRTASKYSDILKPFTSNEACLLTDYINNLRLETTTNYEAAFTAAFDILDRSDASGDSAPCDTNAMLFLTDGEITEGSSGSDLYDMISTRNPNVDVRILTYALGSEVDTSVTRKIAYDNKGAAYSINDDDDLGSVMASYYDLFIGTVVPETVAPIWIRYREYNSGEFVCTVCLSAYDIPYFEENGVSQLLGVVCADLIEEHISDVMGSSDDLYMRLNATASQCPTFENPTEAQLDLIRSTMSGSPHVYTVNWIAWGIPVIVVVSIVIIIIVVVSITGNKSKYTPNQPPSAGSWSVTVSGAGSSEVNGTYVFKHGKHENRYWNTIAGHYQHTQNPEIFIGFQDFNFLKGQEWCKWFLVSKIGVWVRYTRGKIGVPPHDGAWETVRSWRNPVLAITKYTQNQQPSRMMLLDHNPAATNSNAQDNSSTSDGLSQDNPYPRINANLENHAAQPAQPFLEDIPLATPVVNILPVNILPVDITRNQP